MLKNITLSAEQELIRFAREKAQRDHTTLNAQFRQWLKEYTTVDSIAENYDAVMDSISYAKPGKSFSRNEMNER
ncbi:hypothetical protein QUF70_07965 [Desulfobacterales bacterium HSG17]|nr:hypothetical protein [Desulfobacterales bacterium HSG17]